MNGSAITRRVQIASGLATDGAETMHPSLIEKPFLTVADLHLIAKVMTYDLGLTAAECGRLEALEDQLDEYLCAAVGDDWDVKEALVP